MRWQPTEPRPLETPGLQRSLVIWLAVLFAVYLLLS